MKKNILIALVSFLSIFVLILLSELIIYQKQIPGQINILSSSQEVKNNKKNWETNINQQFPYLLKENGEILPNYKN